MYIHARFFSSKGEDRKSEQIFVETFSTNPDGDADFEITLSTRGELEEILKKYPELEASHYPYFLLWKKEKIEKQSETLHKKREILL